MDDWQALESILLALKIEHRQMETEHSRLLVELDVSERELNLLRNENMILRSNQ